MPAKYEFYYFNGHGLGIIPRLLLSLGGFDWKDKFVENWKEEKGKTPFTHVPVLTEYNEDGSKFVLAEAYAIYRYLARKMNIVGETEHEVALVEQYCCSWEELHDKYWPLVSDWKKILTPEQFDNRLKNLLETEIKPIMTKHEEALAKNGTGFYVGDKMTLADIHATISLPLLNIDGNLVSKETHPNLFALQEKLSANEIFQSEAKRFPSNS
ncbi:hypothetical protein K450DRAFT_252225 [Umbelopsis ramanniana AG]|uniref:Glutathione S-transferase n=1 Tax=Umbelopsis ramanniana AG TaxID=1314678 RepID=A0AAD5E4H8_UMBRA|nr:uncharacterized protein K450DRAFT_252225 [Umbelopsis ramanniana AG]KAI8577393.1 hypothetical protein K450DRAFT_252225 [Umbelopsis ramanniana AG]